MPRPCRPARTLPFGVDGAPDARQLPAMRAAWTALLGLWTVACGGRVEAGNQPDAAADVGVVTTVVDASTSDTSYELDCGPTDGGGSTCAGSSYCVAWVAPDAAALPQQFPTDVLRSACESGPVGAVCNGQAPLFVRYDPYDNLVGWAVCAEP
jgi:hypothetical protein